METALNYATIGFGIATVLLFVLGLITAKAGAYHREYMTHGVKADGIIIDRIQTRDTSSDNGGVRHVYMIKYSFPDMSGTPATGTQVLARSEWDKYSIGQKVIVTYLRNASTRNIVYLDALADGAMHAQRLFRHSRRMALLTALPFSASLLLAYQHATAPVLAGGNWSRAEVEVANKRPSVALIDRLVLGRVNIGFNVPLPDDAASGQLPWVVRALDPAIAESISVGDTLAIRIPPENRSAAVLELELRQPRQ